MTYQKQIKEHFKTTHAIALMILNDSIIFDRMSKGFEFMQGSADPQNTYSGNAPITNYNGYGILSKLMINEDNDFLKDEIHNIYEKHLKTDYSKPARQRKTSKEIAQEILTEYECKIFDFKNLTHTN
ncbi:hypothetical protein [Mesonia mobilis]|uniref:Uncharacterized protein n=1 Tax=Mesonia mobilis TaxID=369791 RepID=A0ABQ3BI15_9FLAO|nr:hypothetical protein [Mesonia mobilis]GGZ45947.1 hypothetical protein GCM10008088_04100 [Mesonia mobilis]